jgi:hypothetical protein
MAKERKIIRLTLAAALFLDFFSGRKLAAETAANAKKMDNEVNKIK